MSEVEFISLVDSGIEILDGDRGKNYPAKSDLAKHGDCVFLNTGNVKNNGFDFSDVDFISFEKDFSLRNGKLLREDIVMTTRGTVGNLAYYSKDIRFNHIRINSGMVIIRVNQENWIPYFIYLFLQSDLFKKQTQKLISGSAQPQLPISVLETIRIPNYSMKQQEFIAIQIQAIDQKIALNNQINEELEAMAKTLYDYWFVQFDFPDENGKPYKSSGGKMVYNDQLKREIPEGWGVKQLGEICNIFRGSSPRPIDDFIANKGIPWVKISDVTSLKTPFLLTTKDFILPEGKEKSRFLAPGTLILSNSASPGIPKIVQLDCCVHDGWLIIDNIEGNFSKELLYYYFQDLKKNLVNLGNGSIFKNLKTEYVKELLTIIPLEELLISYNSYCKNIFSQILTFEKQNQELTQLRDWLLPMLMNGQVKVD